MCDIIVLVCNLPVYIYIVYYCYTYMYIVSLYLASRVILRKLSDYGTLDTLLNYLLLVLL